jgi:hypothetical protein
MISWTPDSDQYVFPNDCALEAARTQGAQNVDALPLSPQDLADFALDDTFACQLHFFNTGEFISI